jgi:predicted nucleotidyltransferase
MTRDEILARLRAHADELRRRYGVDSAILFGSRARSAARDGSDIDVAIRFSPPAPASVMAVCGVSGYLSAALGVDVDVIELPASDPALNAAIERDGVPITTAGMDKLKLDALRAKIDRGMADFEAGRTFSHEAVFAQIGETISKR